MNYYDFTKVSQETGKETSMDNIFTFDLWNLVIIFFVGLAAVFVLGLLAYVLYAWYQSRAYGYSGPQESGWVETFSPETAPATIEEFYQSPFQYDVDYESETYRHYEKEFEERNKAFIEQKRQEVTAHLVELQERERQEYWQAKTAQEKAEAEARAEIQKAQEIFGSETYLVNMAKRFHLTRYAEYQTLAKTVYTIVNTAHSRFNGKFPIKRTWKYCREYKNCGALPYADSRQFYERLSRELAASGLLLGGGRGGRSIPPKTLERLWAYSQM